MQRRRVVYLYTLVLILLAVVLFFSGPLVDGCVDCWGGVSGFWRLLLKVVGLGCLACFLRLTDQVVGLPVSSEGRLLGALAVFPVALADLTAPIPGIECIALLAVGAALLLDRRGHAGLSAVVFALAAACRFQLIVFPLWIWISRIALRRRQGKTANLVAGLGLLAAAIYLGLQSLVDVHGVDSWTLKQQVFSLLGGSGAVEASWAVFSILVLTLAAAALSRAGRLSSAPSEALQPREVAVLCFLGLLAAPFDSQGAGVLLLPLCMVSYEAGRESCSGSLRRFSLVASCLALALLWYSLRSRFPWLGELPGLEHCSLLLVAALLLVLAPLHARSHPEAGDDPGCTV